MTSGGQGKGTVFQEIRPGDGFKTGDLIMVIMNDGAPKPKIAGGGVSSVLFFHSKRFFLYTLRRPWVSFSGLHFSVFFFTQKCFSRARYRES